MTFFYYIAAILFLYFFLGKTSIGRKVLHYINLWFWEWSLIILGIFLIAGVTFVYLHFKRNSSAYRNDQTGKELEEIRTALENYRLTNKMYPNTLLDLIGNKPLLQHLRDDSWGNEYRYSLDNEKYTIFSPGEDGESNTKDDILFSNTVNKK